MHNEEFVPNRAHAVIAAALIDHANADGVVPRRLLRDLFLTDSIHHFGADVAFRERRRKNGLVATKKLADALKRLEVDGVLVRSADHVTVVDWERARFIAEAGYLSSGEDP